MRELFFVFSSVNVTTCTVSSADSGDRRQRLPKGSRKYLAMYQKDFDGWNAVKKRIEVEERRVHIRAGEIRWVAFGVNIGSEIDGKGVSFTRPALVVYVIGAHLALVVPMSTNVKNIAGYIPFEWKGATVALCVHQTRIVSQKRILSRKGRVAGSRLEHAKQEITNFFHLSPNPPTSTQTER